MAVNNTVQGSMPPLSVGNVVSAAIQLYRAHFQQYIRVAFTATLWALLPFLLVIPIALFFVVVQKYYATLGLLIPALIILFCYTSAKYLAHSGAISRLAFGELISQPEPSQQAIRYTNERLWGFWSVSLLMSLIFLGISIAFYLLIIVVGGVLLAATGGLAVFQNPSNLAFASNPAPYILAGLGLLVVFLVFIGVIIWLGARFAIAQLPLAIETGVSATKSVGRSWELTKKSAWRIVLILFVGSLITLPLQFLMFFVSSFCDKMLTTVVSADSPTFHLLSPVIGIVIGLIPNILLLPLWQSIKAVLYSDLRRRREGMGLQLRTPNP